MLVEEEDRFLMRSLWNLRTWVWRVYLTLG